MKNMVVRSVLTILLAAVAVCDIAKGVLVLTGVYSPAAAYQGTLFPDATVPTLVAAIVVGGSALLAAATVFIRHAWSVFLAATAGLIMIAWEITAIVTNLFNRKHAVFGTFNFDGSEPLGAPVPFLTPGQKQAFRIVLRRSFGGSTHPGA